MNFLEITSTVDLNGRSTHAYYMGLRSRSWTTHLRAWLNEHDVVDTVSMGQALLVLLVNSALKPSLAVASLGFPVRNELGREEHVAVEDHMAARCALS
jgi:hypothetical protein